jgi:hypothetical protein
MSGNKSKAEATRRLLSQGITPGWLQEEEFAAYHSISVNALREWQKRDPSAPQPEWLGRCKRYKMPNGGSSRTSTAPSIHGDPIMAAIDGQQP